MTKRAFQFMQRSFCYVLKGYAEATLEAACLFILGPLRR